MKKLYLVVSVLMIISMLLVACSTTAPTPITIIKTVEVPMEVIKTVEVEKTVIQTQQVEVTKEVSVPQKATEVRLSGWASSPAETALLKSLLYNFSLANPDITIKYEPITGDYKASLLTMLASGTEPDIFYVDGGYFLEFASNDVLLPMDDLMAGTNTNKSDFISSLLGEFSYDGNVYGIPKDFNTLGLFYNKEMFANAGIPEPTDAWTWDDLKAAAEKLTDLSDPQKPIYGLGVPADAGRFPIFVFQNGGAIMNADLTDTLIDSAAAVDAATYYTDFRKNKTGATPADVGEGWQGTVFGKGQFAMVYEGGWLIPYLAQQFPSTKYGVVLPPSGPKGPGNLIFSVSWSISKNTKNAEAAWKVVEFLTNAESQTTVLESGFALPTRQALQDSDYLKNNAASSAIFRGALNGAVPFVWGLAGNDVNDLMGKGLESVYLKDTDVAAAMKEAAEQIRKKIAEAK